MQVIGRKHNDWLRSLAWSPNGTTLFSHQNEGWFWSAAGKHLYALSAKGDFKGAAFSPDGKTLATVNWPKKVVDLWDAGTGKHRRTLEGHKANIVALAWSPGGKFLASGSEDRTVRIWTANGELRDQFADTRQEKVNALGWLGGDSTLAVLSAYTICLWDVETGKMKHSVPGRMLQGRFSPDGKRLASMHWVPGVTIVETETGAPLGKLVFLRSEKPEDLWLIVGPTGHYRASVPRLVEREIVYVVETDRGQEMLLPEEFASRFNWKNDPEQVRLIAK
jgi:WD40 repeat protein